MSIKQLLSYALILIFLGSASGHKQKASLTFVIDVTTSMNKVIDEVKSTVDEVFYKVINSNASHIENFVLVTFNDSGSEVLTVTTDKTKFYNLLDGITTVDGGGCPEGSLGGILKGLKASNPNSFLYVFTDASAKDYKTVDIVKSLSQKKSIQINFLLTGSCTGYSKKLYLVYEQLSKATSGQIFNISSDDVSEIIEYVATTLQFKKTILAREETTGATIKDIQFTIDSKTWNVFISVGSPHPKFTIVDSKGNEVEINKNIVTTDSNTIVRLEHENIGSYTIKLKNQEKALVSVSGATSICFQYGFSSIPPTSLDETEIRPVGDVTVHNYLAIELDNNERDVSLDTVELINENDVVLKTLHLKLINEKKQFYVTDPFEVPVTMFRIAINGHTTTNEKIKRVSITSTQFPNPQVENRILEIENKTKEMKVKILTENKNINVDFNGDITLKCKVSAVPKPSITWIDDSGNELKHEVTNLDSSQYISVLYIAKIVKNLKLTCKAKNSNGENEEKVTIEVKRKGILDPDEDIKEAPKIDKSKDKYEVKDGEKVKLKCSIIKGQPRPEISWSYNGRSIDAKEEILRLNNVNSANSGTYKCVAHNEAGEDELKIEVVVQYAPVITTTLNKKNIYVQDEEKLILPCSVKGFPNPSVTWFLNNIRIYDSGTYKIFQNKSLSFKGSKFHDVYGKYTCEAENVLSTTRHHYNVKFCEPVTIDPPKSSNVNLEVGGRYELICNAHGIPKPTIEWSKTVIKSTGKLLKESIRSAKNVVKLERAQLKDSGEYKCFAKNECRTKITTMSINVNVLAKPVINLRKKYPNINVIIAGDRKFIIPCEVTGNPKPIVNWVFYKGSKNYKIDKDNNLILENISKIHQDSYTCKAENERGSASYTSTVFVLDAPKPKIKSTRSKIPYILGTPMSFPCKPNRMNFAEHIRWYKDDQLKKTCERPCNYLRPVSEVKDTGTYVCRYLSGGIYYNNFIEIIVEMGLSFKRNLIKTTFNYVENSEVVLDCDAEGNNAITWKSKFSDGVYSTLKVHESIYKFKMTPDRIQTYTCIVKNKVCSITRTFEIISDMCCRVDLPFVREMPFFMYKKDLRIASSTLPINSIITIYCSDTGQIISDTLALQSPTSAKCHGDTIFETEQGFIDISKIKCSTLLNFKTTDMETECFVDSSKLIGIEIPLSRTSSHTIFNICIDLNKRIPQFVKYIIAPSMSNKIPENIPDFIESEHIELDYTDIYNCKKQLDNIYATTHVRLDNSYKNCFIKSQLVNPRDLMPGFEQFATYTYLNVVPVWSTYRNGNWEEVENRIRSLTKSLNVSLEVWAGAAGEMNLPGQVTGDKVIINDRHHNFLRIPRYIWKVVLHRAERKGLAIVLVNIPNLNLRNEIHDMGCDDKCDKTTWMNNKEWRNVKKGFVFCCDIKAFKKKFQYENLFPSYNILTSD